MESGSGLRNVMTVKRIPGDVKKMEVMLEKDGNVRILER